MIRRVVLSRRAVRHLDEIHAYVQGQSGAARADIFPGLRVMGFRQPGNHCFRHRARKP